MILAHLTTRDEVSASFMVMKSLRPHLTDVSDYCDRVYEQFGHGYRLLAATEAGAICGLAGYRHAQNLIFGSFTYLDDLVVQEGDRGRNIGELLLSEVRNIARGNGSKRLVLDTGLANSLAQRFYFRNGLLAAGMHFGETLTPSMTIKEGKRSDETAESTFDIVYDRHCTGSTKWDRYGRDVIAMGLADMDFPAPKPVLEAIKCRLAHPILGYSVAGEELRSQIVNDMQRKYQWQISREDIVFLPGVMPGVNMALSGHLEQGDGVVVQPPVYGPMLAAPHNWNLRSQPVPLVLQGAEWVYDVGSMQAGLSISKALLFCNPQNPTGKVFTRTELETVAELCREQGNLIISNESHCDLIYDGRQHVPFASLSEDAAQRTITLMSASKAYNIAGLKTAFAIVQNKALRDTFEASRFGMVDSVNAFGLVATHAAYSQAGSWKTELLAYLAANRDHLTARLSNALPMLRVIPAQGTFLAWIDCSRLGLANPHRFFLENAKVGMSNGADFGTGYEQFVRLNYGCPRSVLDAALDRLEIAVNALHLPN